MSAQVACFWVPHKLQLHIKSAFLNTQIGHACHKTQTKNALWSYPFCNKEDRTIQTHPFHAFFPPTPAPLFLWSAHFTTLPPCVLPPFPCVFPYFPVFWSPTRPTISPLFYFEKNCSLSADTK